MQRDHVAEPGRGTIDPHVGPDRPQHCRLEQVEPDRPQQGHVCPKCKDKRFVVLDVNYGHPQFAKLIPCDLCHGAEQVSLSPWPEVQPPPDLRRHRSATVSHHSHIAPVLAAVAPLCRPPHGFVTLSGPPGRGKSTVMACAYNEALAARLPALYVSIADLCDRLRRTFDPDSPLAFDAAFEWVQRVPVLCLDEFERFNASGWTLEKVGQLISTRYDYRQERLTCLATNTTIASLPDFLQSRINDRECHRFELTGPDLRKRSRAGSGETGGL